MLKNRLKVESKGWTALLNKTLIKLNIKKYLITKLSKYYITIKATLKLFRWNFSQIAIKLLSYWIIQYNISNADSSSLYFRALSGLKQSVADCFFLRLSIKINKHLYQIIETMTKETLSLVAYPWFLMVMSANSGDRLFPALMSFFKVKTTYF